MLDLLKVQFIPGVSEMSCKTERCRKINVCSTETVTMEQLTDIFFETDSFFVGSIVKVFLLESLSALQDLSVAPCIFESVHLNRRKHNVKTCKYN